MLGSLTGQPEYKSNMPAATSAAQTMHTQQMAEVTCCSCCGCYPGSPKKAGVPLICAPFEAALTVYRTCLSRVPVCRLLSLGEYTLNSSGRLTRPKPCES